MTNADRACSGAQTSEARPFLQAHFLSCAKEKKIRSANFQLNRYKNEKVKVNLK